MLSQSDALYISRVQSRFREAGFQWIEHIFNDRKHGDCYCSIKMTISDIPTYFSQYSVIGDIGWGRFERVNAWTKAELWLDKALADPSLIPKPKTEPYPV